MTGYSFATKTVNELPGTSYYDVIMLDMKKRVAHIPAYKKENFGKASDIH